MGVVSELPEDWCAPTWEHEFLVPDFLKYADIVRSGRAVADIHEATGGRPDRSPGSASTARAPATTPRCAWPSRSATPPGASAS